MTIYHWHHIVPKHAGGTDDPSNLVRLTVEEHAEAHRQLYEQYGKKEDYVAWQGLLGMIGREEIIREASKIGAKKTGQIQAENFYKGKINSAQWWFTKEGCKKRSDLGIESLRKKYKDSGQWTWSNKTHSDETKYLMREIHKKNKHQQGSKNSQYGTMWITNGEKNRKIKKVDSIPEGWYKGRKSIK